MREAQVSAAASPLDLAVENMRATQKNTKENPTIIALEAVPNILQNCDSRQNPSADGPPIATTTPTDRTTWALGCSGQSGSLYWENLHSEEGPPFRALQKMLQFLHPSLPRMAGVRLKYTFR